MKMLQRVTQLTLSIAMAIAFSACEVEPLVFSYKFSGQLVGAKLDPVRANQPIQDYKFFYSITLSDDLDQTQTFLFHPVTDQNGKFEVELTSDDESVDFELNGNIVDVSVAASPLFGNPKHLKAEALMASTPLQSSGSGLIQARSDRFQLNDELFSVATHIVSLKENASAAPLLSKTDSEAYIRATSHILNQCGLRIVPGKYTEVDAQAAGVPINPYHSDVTKELLFHNQDVRYLGALIAGSVADRTDTIGYAGTNCEQ